jgi:hypothetical protein
MLIAVELDPQKCFHPELVKPSSFINFSQHHVISSTTDSGISRGGACQLFNSDLICIRICFPELAVSPSASGG